MPQVGERRSGATETVEWNGSRWAPVGADGSVQVPATFARVNGQDASPSTVDNSRSFGLLDYVPGLKDALNIPENLYKGASALPDVARGLVSNPGATLKGFASGASEAATPGRTGLLALLTGGATLPAALAAAGGQSVADATRVATGAPNAPTSLMGGAGDVAEAASVPAVAAAATAVPGLVSKIPGAVGSAVQKVGPSTAYGTLGAIDGYRRGGITGAIEEGLIGAAGGRLSGRLSKALDAISPEAGAAPTSAAPAMETAVAESAPSAISPIERARLRRQGYTPQMIDSFEQQLSTKAPAPLPSLPKINVPGTGGRSFQTVAPINRVASKLDSAIGGLTGDTATAAADNIANGSSFSNGHIIPEARPTELTDLAEEGGARHDPPYDIDYGGVMPDFTFEAGDPNRPGLSVGSAGPKTTLDRLETATAAANPASSTPGGREMQSFTDFSDALDPIINAATPADFPPPRTGFLSRSTPTKADLAGLAKLRAGNPDYPYAEMPQDKLASILRSLQPQ